MQNSNPLRGTNDTIWYANYLMRYTNCAIKYAPG